MSHPRAYVVTPESMYSDAGGIWPTPAGIMTDLAYLLSRTAKLFGDAGGVVVLSGVQPTQISTAGLDAWRWPKIDGWTTFRPKTAGTSPTVQLCVLDAVPPRRSDLFNADTPPDVIAQRLGRIHGLLGVPYRMTPGVTGNELMRSLHTDRRKARQPVWITASPPPARMAGPLHWKREPNLVELAAAGARAVKFDVRACYATAAGAAPLAWQALEHTPDALYQRGLAGYWLIRPPLLHGGNGPEPCDRSKAVTKDGRRIGVWVTTPIMELYDDHGVHPDVIDAWTAPDVDCSGPKLPPSPRILRSWSEKLADVRGQVTAALLDSIGEPRAYREWQHLQGVIKHVGNDALGQAVRSGGRVSRKDWNDTGIDQARANQLRKVYARVKVDGVWPLRCSGVDSMWYATTHPDQTGMEPWTGDGPGKLRLVDELPLAVYIERSNAHAAGVKAS